MIVNIQIVFENEVNIFKPLHKKDLLQLKQRF